MAKTHIRKSIMEIEVGTILIAKMDFMMDGNREQALVKGKEYPILKDTGVEFIIKSELTEQHWFTKKQLKRYFTIKE